MKGLIVSEVYRTRVLRQAGSGKHALKNTGDLLAEMIFLQRSGNDRIEAVDDRSQAERGTDQTVRAGAETASAQAGAAGRCTRVRADAADAASGRVENRAHRSSQDGRPGSRPQHVGIGNVQRVAGDRHVEIVLESERDGVIQREIQLAIAHQGIDARRVSQAWFRQMPRRVRADWIGKMRHRLGIV